MTVDELKSILRLTEEGLLKLFQLDPKLFKT